MKKISLLIALFSIGMMFQSCQKENQNLNDGAPVLPSLQMFQMPSETFQNVVSNDTQPGVNDTYENWFHAAFSFLAWHTVVVVGVTSPVYVFAKAFEVDPVHIGGASWEWSYSIPAEQGNGSNFDVRLVGTVIEAAEVEWNLYVSEEGQFQDFQWISGTTKEENKSSTFTIYDNPVDPFPSVGLNFESSSATTSSLRFTNVIPTDQGNGHYVEYRTDKSQFLDSAFDVFRGQEDFLQILISDDTEIGRVKHAKHYGDDEFHCWDIEKKDTDC